MTRRSTLAAAAAALFVLAGTAQAAAIVNDNSTVFSIPGLTGFATSGDEMTGLAITATFSNQAAQTGLWATTGPGSGAAGGTGWRVSLSGDSFAQFGWEFSIDPTANLGQLLRLVIDGASALTVLDTTFSGLDGTAGSSNGRDFALDDAGFDANATATYSNVVAIGANAPVGDLYQTLTVTFGANGGPRTNFRFSQDTDNDMRFTRVPEPGSLALAGLALAALGAQARRRQSRRGQA